MSDELRKALEDAADEQELPDDEGTPGDKSGDEEGDEKDDKSDKSKKTEETDEEDDEDEEEKRVASEEQQKALELYRMFTDPKQVEGALAKIAERAGYKLESLTPKQQRAVADEIEATLEEVLGDDFSILPPNFGKALSAAIEKKMAKSAQRIDELETRLAQKDQLDQQSKVNEALAWAATEFSDFDDPIMQKRILREMKELPPKPGTNFQSYIKKMYRLAGGKAEKSSQSERNSRTNRNLDERKPSDSSRGERAKKPVLSLAEAVEAAFEENHKT